MSCVALSPSCKSHVLKILSLPQRVQRGGKKEHTWQNQHSLTFKVTLSNYLPVEGNYSESKNGSLKRPNFNRFLDNAVRPTRKTS